MLLCFHIHVRLCALNIECKRVENTSVAALEVFTLSQSYLQISKLNQEPLTQLK